MYIRSSISAQSLASVPPSRALMLTIASLRVVRAAQQRLQLQVVQLRLGGVEMLAQLGDEALVLLGHLDQRADLAVGADQLVQRLEQRVQPLQLRTTAWARSWLFQKSAADIRSSSSRALLRLRA